jgi:phage terminase large subunit GpA-like protein
VQYGEEYFKQLTAERMLTRFPRGSWEKEPGRRNKALGCRIYARAAASIYGLDRFEERH